MKYSVIDGVYIAEIPLKDFKIVMNDSKKKTAAPDNFCNAGFFAGYDEGKVHFTLPVAHLVCDFDADCKWTKHYCEERGDFKGDKFFFDSSKWSYQNNFCGKSISSLVVTNNSARIQDIVTLPQVCNYVISGVPIMRGGRDVVFANYVKSQGWGSGSLYATTHMFIGLKEATATTIYAMAMKTKTGNMITSAEAYKKFKKLGFYDVIKLDGGGSTIMKVNKKNVVCTAENRHINTIILFGDSVEVEKKPVVAPSKPTIENNPYKKPTRNLKKGMRGEDVKWLQYQLNELGFYCGEVDGDFGANTQKQTKLFQKDRKLTADGIAGPKTYEAMD